MRDVAVLCISGGAPSIPTTNPQLPTKPGANAHEHGLHLCDVGSLPSQQKGCLGWFRV